MVCEKCGNRLWFTFGTCVECGYNYLDKSYHHIKVYVDDLPKDIKWRLIDKHDESVTKFR
jgi:hypothetical protein